jgi:probable F420-dependent oxidoreductase
LKIRFAIAPGVPNAAGAFAEMVDALESSGFDGIWLSDVTLAPVSDPLVGLAFAASRTTRLKLGANIVPLGRNPFLLAKALAQLDELSGGRVLLSFVPGIGLGREREVLGVGGSDRGALLEETLCLVRAWWSGEKVTRSSPHWHFEAVELPQRPAQDPLEVWLGGSGPKALRRAGRVADGWLGAALTPVESGEARSVIEFAADEAGRSIDPEHFGMSLAYARSAPDPATLGALGARRRGVDPLELLPVGAESLRTFVRAYLDAGLSKFVLRPLQAVSSWREELAWLEDAVLGMQT